MIGEDFGPVRVLATGGVAVFYGGGSMCAHRTKKTAEGAASGVRLRITTPDNPRNLMRYNDF